MNRLNALTILHNSKWMNTKKFITAISKYGAETAIMPNCPELADKAVIWVEHYDMDLIKMLLGGTTKAVLYKNFNAWFDDGTTEVRITEDNYLKFDYTKFYLDHTCKYCPPEEDLV